MKAAKIFCLTRMDLVRTSPFIINTYGEINPAWCIDFQSGIDKAENIHSLMGVEGNWSKKLYSHMAQDKGFKRIPAKGEDLPNRRLDHGNYIAYGFAAVALKALNIPYSLLVMHGRTNRGALIFDVADIVKDAVVLPSAFENNPKYRELIVQRFKHGRKNYIEHMIEAMKTVMDTL